MKLDPAGCEWYKLVIVTEPATAATDWEASIDGGATYEAATEVDESSAWLVAGADYEGGEDPSFVLSKDSTRVKVRLIDAPETIIRSAPRISVSS